MMKKLNVYLMAGALLVGGTSCKKTETAVDNVNSVPKTVLESIKQLGFSTDHVVAKNGGYLVEGDIFLTNENLSGQSESQSLRIADVEHYRTTNLVRIPRTVTVSVSNLTQPH